MSLNKRHRKLLTRDSGISDEIVAQRGYRTVKTVDDLVTRGFKARQVRGHLPGLLIPLHPPGLAPESRQPVLYRPDEPWWHPTERRWVKYLAPQGSRNYIDVHPAMQDELADPDWPAFITEGHRKADSAVSRELLTLGLGGVDNWVTRLRDDNGRRMPFSEPCPEWEHIPMHRDWIIVYDSDQASNPKVSGARMRLTRFLRLWGADRVFWIDLPSDEGRKVGLDDWFVDGGSIDGLRALVREAPKRGAGQKGRVA